MSDEQRPLTPHDPRLPAVRARLFTLVRSLARQGVLALPLALDEGPPTALHLLPVLWQRLRVELFGPPLLDQLIPDIERRVASMGERVLRVEHQLSPRATVDWPATWRQSLQRPHLQRVVTRHWARQLDLPENQLAAAALRAVDDEATRAASELPPGEECHTLSVLHERAERKRRAVPWRTIQPLDAAGIEAALPHLEQAQLPAWRALAQWWRQWRRWHTPHHAPGTTLLDPALEPDWLFELLVLFELVAALAQRFPLWQQRALGDASQPPLFAGRAPAGRFLVYYQTGAMFRDERSLKAIRAIPDIVIQLPAERGYVLIDAKNYGARGHSQGIYKMLGYLYQFGYQASGEHRFHRIRGGVLAFPTEEREGRGLQPWHQPVEGAQPVMSFVLPPLTDARYHGLEDLVAWLVAAMEEDDREQKAETRK